MTNIFRSILKSLLPRPVRGLIKGIAYNLSNALFTPYVIKKSVEGENFDFLIGDTAAREWYDSSRTSPEWPMLRFIRDNMIKKGDVVIDCGAHHGCTTVVLSRWIGNTGKVISFEPVPKNFEILEKNIRFNGLANITCERKAVGARKGKIRINGLSNSWVIFFNGGSKIDRFIQPSIETDMVSLDEYEYLNPNLIKIDVEGFEVEVLKGAEKILSRRPQLIIEIHTENLQRYGTSVQELFGLINQYRYDLWIQWDFKEKPQKYDRETPINKRVQLFCIP